MENNEISELEVNDELIGMISGKFENKSSVETRDLPRLVENEKIREDDEDIGELPEHRFICDERRLREDNAVHRG